MTKKIEIEAISVPLIHRATCNACDGYAVQTMKIGNFSVVLCDKCFKELVTAVRLYDIREMNERLSGLANIIKKTKGKRR